MVSSFLFKKKKKDLFLERGGGKETLIHCLLSAPQLRAWTRNPGTCPDWESNPRIFALRGHAQPTEPRGQGSSFSFQMTLATAQASFFFKFCFCKQSFYFIWAFCNHQSLHSNSLGIDSFRSYICSFWASFLPSAHCPSATWLLVLGQGELQEKIKIQLVPQMAELILKKNKVEEGHCFAVNTFTKS